MHELAEWTPETTAHIDSYFFKLPKTPHVVSLLLNLINEIANAEAQEEDLNLFYHPFLGLLFTIAFHVLEKITEALIKIDIPPEFYNGKKLQIVDKETVDTYYDLHPITNPFDWERRRALLNWAWFCTFYESICTVIGTSVPEEKFATWVTNNINSVGRQPLQWNDLTITSIAQWLTLMTEPDFRKNHPWYIYIKSSYFPLKVPRIYRHQTWASGFGGRLVVPNLLWLTSQQKAELWNNLLVEEKIYDSENIDHTVRDSLFEILLNQIPENALIHVDLCGGRGDFISFLREKNENIQSHLVDIADEAVSHAKSHHRIDAHVANVDEDIPFPDGYADVITIIYAVQWLEETAFDQVRRILKPGGKLLFNAYPPEEVQAEQYVDVLNKHGFIQVSFQEYDKNGRSHYLVTAYKA